MAETKTLIVISSNGNVEGVKKALQRGGDPSKIFGTQTALHAAASGGHQEIVAVLLEHPGVDPNCYDNLGLSALHIAVHLGHYRVGALLLQQPGIEVNIPDNSGSTPLHFGAASTRTSPELVELLLKQPGININARDRWGETALHLAARFDREEILGLLLEQPGIDEKATTNSGASVLRMAVIDFGGPNILRRLLTSPNTDPNARDNRGKTPIMCLLNRTDNLDQVKCLQAMVEFMRVDLDLETPDRANLEDLAR